MIRLLVLSALLILPLRAQEPPAAQQAEDPLAAACALIKADNLKKHLEYLAGDDLEGRCTGYEGNDKATEYISKHYEKLGLKKVGDKNDKGEPTHFQAFKVGGRPTRNTVAFFEGTDPVLKDEIVVIGAHHDHVGKVGQANAGRFKNKDGDEDDKIWNGADDNGSGTVTVLEITRGFMEGKIKTKRSVLFMTFSGEEFGLLGSAHYVKNPIFPLDKTAAMINLDMVGRNPDNALDVGGVSTAAQWNELAEKAAVGTGVKYKTSATVTPGSDHYNFAKSKIPAVHFFTGFHNDYHCQTDHVDKIAFDNMEKIGRFGLKLLVTVANLDKRMEYKGATGGATASGRRRLGINYEALNAEDAAKLGLDKGRGGIRIKEVNDGSVAEAAGVAVGDILIEFNKSTFPLETPLETLRDLLGKVTDNVDVPLALIRDGKRVEVNARWKKDRLLGIGADVLEAEAAADLKLAEGMGGLVLTSVGPDSVAEKAGLKEEDVIVEFNGVKLPLDAPLEKLRVELAKIEDGKEVPIVIFRSGKRMELKATWSK